MTLFGGVREVAQAAGDGVVDWEAAAAAAQATIPPGDLDLDADERAAYADDVRAARREIEAIGAIDVDVPRTVEVQNRHHWIDANIQTFRRIMAPLEDRAVTPFAGPARVVNTGTMAVLLSFLGRHVLGQYDPVLLSPGDDHGLYFVRPNILDVADQLAVDPDRFRRWIAFHEVAHAAEFGQAPWLQGHLETRVEDGVRALAEGQFDRSTFRELETAMTAVEGYAELLMDRAFDDDPTELREKLEARRRSRDPLTAVLSRLLGLSRKRRQYERGSAFFEAVADARGLDAAGAAWDAPDNLPRDHEIDDPAAWLARVDP